MPAIDRTRVLHTIATLVDRGDRELAALTAQCAVVVLPADAALWATLSLLAEAVDVAEVAADRAVRLADEEPLAWIARARVWHVQQHGVLVRAAIGAAVARGADRDAVEAIVFAL